MAISISGTTLTFNDATTQTTARTASNTVTSIVAGTGITVSGATGAVTVTNSSPGAVASVNGQTGAVVLTNAGDIGSIGVFMNASNTNVAYSSTIAGSSLRFNETANQSAPQGQAPFYFYYQICNANYGGGGTALSGTWRKLNTGSVFTSTFCGCSGITTRNYMRALYIRVS